MDTGNFQVEKQDSIQFPLKKLSLNSNLFGTEQNLILVMSKLTETLEELIFAKLIFPDYVYEIIINKFRKLKTLEISVPSFFRYQFFSFCEKIFLFV